MEAGGVEPRIALIYKKTLFLNLTKIPVFSGKINNNKILFIIIENTKRVPLSVLFGVSI